jgi:hypothetical protein
MPGGGVLSKLQVRPCFPEGGPDRLHRSFHRFMSAAFTMRANGAQPFFLLPTAQDSRLFFQYTEYTERL